MDKYQLVKYHGKWALYLRDSQTYEFIGAGKTFITQMIEILNEKEKQK